MVRNSMTKEEIKTLKARVTTLEKLTKHQTDMIRDLSERLMKLELVENSRDLEFDYGHSEEDDGLIE